MGYEIIEHTADVGFEAWAPDLDGLFVEAARAMVSVMGHGHGEVVHRQQVSLDAPDVEALLVDWLSELLFLFEARDVVPDRMRVRVRSAQAGAHLEAEIDGTDAGRFVQEGPQVKAVTYHGLQVRTDGARGAEARVYLDV